MIQKTGHKKGAAATQVGVICPLIQPQTQFTEFPGSGVVPES